MIIKNELYVSGSYIAMHTYKTVINFCAYFGGPHLPVRCWEDGKRMDFNTQIVAFITLGHVLSGELTVSRGEVFFNTEYFRVVSVPPFLVAGHQNVSGFPPKTIFFWSLTYWEDVLSKRIGHSPKGIFSLSIIVNVVCSIRFIIAL